MVTKNTDSIKNSYSWYGIGLDARSAFSLSSGDGYSINFTEQQKKFCLNLHYNISNSFLLVNGVKTYQFKEKESKISSYSLCLLNF